MNTLFSTATSFFDRHPATYLETIWQTFFADIPRANVVKITYGKAWKRRLGSIWLSTDEQVSHITINPLLLHPEVPAAVLITTIAHELAYYAHGFGSPLPRTQKHPHASGVVTRELEKRGLAELHRQCQAWTEQEWLPFYTHQIQAGWMTRVIPLEMAVPPTPERCFSITLALLNGGWFYPTPTPLTEREARWLKGYIVETLQSSHVQIRLIQTSETHNTDQARAYALALSVEQSDPITVRSLADWVRIRGWAAEPSRLERECSILSEELRASERQRVRQLWSTIARNR